MFMSIFSYIFGILNWWLKFYFSYLENPEPWLRKQCEVPSCKFKSGVFGPIHSIMQTSRNHTLQLARTSDLTPLFVTFSGWFLAHSNLLLSQCPYSFRLKRASLDSKFTKLCQQVPPNLKFDAKIRVTHRFTLKTHYNKYNEDNKIVKSREPYD